MNKHFEYVPSNSMRELILDNNLLLPVISRFDIAFGFGDRPVAEICRENNVDTDTFLSVCNFLSGYSQHPDNLSLPSLIGYLKRAHTSFLDITFPRIRHNLIDSINYSETNDLAFLLIKFFDDYVAEVKRHMKHEDETVFKYVDRLLEGRTDNDFRISRFSVNHSHMASKLKELKDIFIYHYAQKDNARLSAALFDIIVCERDLMTHFEVENKLFIPAVANLEKELHSMEGRQTEQAEGVASSPSPLGSLSEREKDIIRCVACGKSNKEIADELCISTNTVATHRRNISAKLDIHSGAGLTIFAIINHLVDLKDVNPQ